MEMSEADDFVPPSSPMPKITLAGPEPESLVTTRAPDAPAPQPVEQLPADVLEVNEPLQSPHPENDDGAEPWPAA
jgi:hypothetical protein